MAVTPRSGGPRHPCTCSNLVQMCCLALAWAQVCHAEVTRTPRAPCHSGNETLVGWEGSAVLAWRLCCACSPGLARVSVSPKGGMSLLFMP